MITQTTELILRVAQKLGINNSDIAIKACDYVRSINAKSKIAMNEMLKAVICLDIASCQLGGKFEKAAALQLAVITKSQYQKNYLLCKNLLQIETHKTIHEICVQLGCEEITKIAEILFSKYKEHDNISKDFLHPQYAVGAVYTICKLQKIPVKKAKFIEISTLKPQQWTKLENDFEKFVEDQNFTVNVTKKSKRKTGNEYLHIIEQRSSEIEKPLELQAIKNTELDPESYGVWKSRILKEAYMHCDMLNNSLLS